MSATPMSHGHDSDSGVKNGAVGRRRDDLGEARWIAACAGRLAALRPGLGLALARETARRMWPEVGHFDPGMAAELEHEAWPMDD